MIFSVKKLEFVSYSGRCLRDLTNVRSRFVEFGLVQIDGQTDTQ